MSVQLTVVPALFFLTQIAVGSTRRMFVNYYAYIARVSTAVNCKGVCRFSVPCLPCLLCKTRRINHAACYKSFCQQRLGGLILCWYLFQSHIIIMGISSAKNTFVLVHGRRMNTHTRKRPRNPCKGSSSVMLWCGDKQGGGWAAPTVKRAHTVK